MANTSKKTNTGNKKGTKKTTSASATKKMATTKKKTATASANKSKAVKTATTKSGTRSKTSAAKITSTGAKKSTATTAKKKTTTAKKTTTKKEIAPKEEKLNLVDELENEVKEEKVIKTSSNNEKRNKIFTIAAIAILLVAIILSCFASNKNGKYNKKPNQNASQTTTGGAGTGGASAESEAIKDEERKELNNISIDDYLSLLNGEEASIIYIARPTCSHCQVQKPIMENLVFKYENLKINYLNTDELDNEGIKKLQSSDEFFNEGWGTPTTLIVKGGKIVDSIAGETSGASLVELFKKYGIID